MQSACTHTQAHGEAHENARARTQTRAPAHAPDRTPTTQPHLPTHIPRRHYYVTALVLDYTTTLLYFYTTAQAFNGAETSFTLLQGARLVDYTEKIASLRATSCKVLLSL